jgi:hypothetical protein
VGTSNLYVCIRNILRAAAFSVPKTAPSREWRESVMPPGINVKMITNDHAEIVVREEDSGSLFCFGI